LNALDAVLVAGVKIGNVQQWCRDNDVNPRTFYRHQARILAEGSWTNAPADRRSTRVAVERSSLTTRTVVDRYTLPNVIRQSE
jgi:hypothetical protein